MQKHGRKRRLMPAMLAVAVWLCLGLMLPIVAGLWSSDTALQDSVIAAPRHSFTIAQPVVLGQAPRIRVERGTIVVVDPTGKPLAVTDSQQLLPATNLLLENALISVGETAPGSRSVTEQFAEALAPLVDALAATKYETLQLRRTTVVVGIGGAAAEPLNDVQASISLRRKGTVAIKGTGLLRGQRVSLDATVNTSLNAKSVDGRPVDGRFPLKLSIKAPLVDVVFDGRLNAQAGLNLQGQGELSIRAVRQVARWLGAFWSPGPGLRDLTAKGQVALAGQTLSFEQANFSIDGNEATGAVAIGFNGTRPQLSGTMAFTTLDVGRYLFSSASEQQEALSWSTLATSALTVPLGMNLDADIRVSAERGRLASFDFGRSAATVVLKDGQLSADIAELPFAGGQGGGQIRADFNGYQPKLSLRGRLDGADLGLLSTVSAGHAMVQASAIVVADLSGAGATPSDLLQSLAGKISIKTPEGGRFGLDLRQLAGMAQANDTIGWPAATLRGRTTFDQMDLKLIVRDGVLLTETAEAALGDGAWTATGLMNLPLRRIDIRLIQSLAAPVTKPGGTPIKPAVLELRGPWSQPVIRSLTEPNNASGVGVTPEGRPNLPVARPDRG